MKQVFSFLFLSILFFLMGCATSYKSNGFSGGYSETQLDINVFKVSFRGNGYTSRDRASDFALLRCAELALHNGFNFFIIVDSDSSTSYGTYTTPTTTSTTANVNVYGNSAYGKSRSTTYGGGKQL